VGALTDQRTPAHSVCPRPLASVTLTQLEALCCLVQVRLVGKLGQVDSCSTHQQRSPLLLLMLLLLVLVVMLLLVL
jgi:hypothetical protein